MEILREILLQRSALVMWNGMNVVSLIQHAEFMKKVNIVIECDFQEENRMYYGDFLVLIEGNERNILAIERSDGQEKAMDGNESGLGGIVAIQLDELTEEDSVRKGNRIAKR